MSYTTGDREREIDGGKRERRWAGVPGGVVHIEQI